MVGIDAMTNPIERASEVPALYERPPTSNPGSLCRDPHFTTEWKS